MPDYSAGTASIRIRPDASRFIADLKRDLASKNAEFVMQVSADTGQARADIDRFRQVQQRNGIGIGVDVDVARAQSELTAFRARNSGNLDIKVNAQTRGAAGELATLSKHLESFRRSDFLRLNLGAGLISGIGPALTGLAQVAASVQQIAQAGLALPGVFAGAGASLSTLVVGLSGIKDAYDAVSTAAESSGVDQAASARAAASAQNQLRNSNVDLENAYGDLARATRDARQELTDLRVEQRGGMLDESRAILEAQKAREDIAAGNYSDIRDAALRVAEADQRLIEVRNRNAQTQQRLNDANAKGIAGSDQVVAANERVTRSQQQVADAQAAVAAAGSKTSAAQDKASRAMADLGPNAQAVVRAMVDMKPAFQDFRTAISEPLLDGKAEEFTKFFDTVSPIARSGMAQIARSWNSNISALFDSAASDDGRGLIDRILGNTADAQGRLSAAMDPLVKGLGTLTAAGTDALPRLADGLTAVLERFRTFIVEADQDGRLEKWINDGIDGVSSLGNSVLNIGKSFTAITQAVQAGGGRTFLQWLQDVTGRMQTFLNSTEGQQQLKNFFAEGREMFEQWRPILEDIPALLKGIHDGAVTYIGGMLKVIEPVTDVLASHPELIENIVVAFAAWKTIDGVTSLIGNLGKINDLLGGPGKGGRGGKGILGRLALLGGGALLLDGLIEDNPTDPAAPPPSAGQSVGDLATNVATGAGAGGIVAGVPGAVVGGAGGVATTIADRVTGDYERGRAEADRRAEEQRAQHRGETTGPYAPPQTVGPGAVDELRAKIAAGQLPGYTIAPDGAIIGPDGKPLPAFDRGGPTPSGKGPGPTGGWLSEIHSDEWVLPKRARRLLGDVLLWKMTQGRSFEVGGYIDENGNPITPGTSPGPMAPNPMSSSGGIPGIFGQIASGLQTPINTGVGLLGAATPHGAGTPSAAAPSPIAAVGQNLLGNIIPGLGGSPGSSTGSTGVRPGLAGLFDAGGNPDMQKQWITQTGSWLADFASSTLLKFGEALLTGGGNGGILGMFGLQGLMQQPLLQGIGQTVNHLGGVASQLNSTAPSAMSSAAVGQPGTVLGAGGGTVTLLDANGAPITIDVPGNSAAARIDAFAQSNAIGQKYVYGGVGGGGKDGGVGGFDCSGIASAIYAEAKGLPQGTRYFTTESDFEALGFKPGNVPGALNIGVVRGGGGPNSHMALTLPNGVNVESGGAHGTTAYGGPAKGAGDFPLRWHLPLPADTKQGGIIPGLFDGIPNIGMLPAGITVAHNKTGQPEMVLPPNETKAIRSLAKQIDRQPPPRRDVPDARTINPNPLPIKQLPTADRREPVTAPPPVAQQPPAKQLPPAAQQPVPDAGSALGPAVSGVVPQGIIAPQTGIDHALPWVNQAIMSTASTLGNIAATAASMGAAAGGAGPAGGAAGSMISGLFTQGGKTITKLANVISSSLVGSVPGSFTDLPSGQVMRAEQRRPDVADYRGGGGNTYNVTGYSPEVISREIQAHEALDRQARLATMRG